MSSSRKIPRLSEPANQYEEEDKEYDGRVQIDDLKDIEFHRCEQIEDFKEKIDSITNTLCEQKGMMCYADEESLHLTFPLKSHEDLAVADMAIQNGSQLVYIKALKRLIYPNGILKQFKDIISDELANEYNVDGFHGQKCLKNYQHFYDALLSSTDEDNAEELIRKAVHLAKKRQSKRNLLKQAHNIL
ncbi:uncharacterized protein LOC115770435 [Drosophila novamexicana]|uniref:uncharacterized protein LOC115770435 n=1 Tax=Drosophila novamexicana TaxID=47314 RepID=UPI0011E5E90F|nr:uncharacterized protein LOC115770435 [Drosophila novamexicana]